MRSNRPKPLHMMCGRSMVMHVIHALELVKLDQTVVVVGHGGDRVSRTVREQAPAWANVNFVEQKVQRGTGDAAMVGMTALPGDDLDDDSTIIVLPGDTPLLRPETIDALVAAHHANGYAATAITTVLDDPTGYGRVIRAPSKDGTGRMLKVVEQRDADDDQRAIREVWTSMCAFRRDLLGPALRKLSPDNAQGEYYLTDVVEVLASMGHQIGAISAPEAETRGVNDRWQLAMAERELRNRTNRHWLLNGVTMLDPRQTFIDVTVQLGKDVTIYPGTLLQGQTAIGSGCEIGPNVRLSDTVVGDNCRIEQTVARSSTIADGCTVGPFAHLPEGTVRKAGTSTGAFYTGETEGGLQ